MHKQGVGDFPYFVGISSLSEIATREDRVCVLNLLGSESSMVTPASHEYSGGNVVFGTGPGKSGMRMETRLGIIPVYNSVRDGINAGHEFNTGVVYLPPAAVKDGVLEMIRQNPKLEKVVIVTEKVSVKDSRTIRAVCQMNGVDVFGANCLGVADAWNKVRIGGALGGSSPEESLVKGSIAVYSNSGNFTTTIPVYLLTRGWGTTTSISSGKDVYVHYGPKEFALGLDNDDRSKAAVMYVEPGGYYEYGLTSDKPIVACIVGRWKSKITRACGHAGSLAGSGDDARTKEKWFMDNFGVDDLFTPENPVFSKKGAVVTNIAHIAEALTAVMAANGVAPDFEQQSDLRLKCWFANDTGLRLPDELDVGTVVAVSPYNEQIELASRQIGAQFPREILKDASGASMMDPVTQVASMSGVSILDASKHSFEDNLVLSLIKEYPDKKRSRLVGIALNACVNMYGGEAAAVAAAEASRANDNSPNSALCAAVSIIGRKIVQRSLDASELLLELFRYDLEEDPFRNGFDCSEQLDRAMMGTEKNIFINESADEKAETVLRIIAESNSDSVFTDFLRSLADKVGGYVAFDALLAAIWMTVGWSSLKRKKISRFTICSLPWYSQIFSAFLGCSTDVASHTRDSFCGIGMEELISEWTFTEVAFLVLMGRRPTQDELFEFTVVLGLIVTNGPGTISAQGAKGAVSSDGPLRPERVQINKCFAGFLTHTGFAHGGNGFEAIEFLKKLFEGGDLDDPGDAGHGIDLKEVATAHAKAYGDLKKREKFAGNLEYAKIPCVNHPIFKGKEVNIDPREAYVRQLFEERGIYNAFLDFYHELVEALFAVGVTRNVFCVNIDAVIAVILLKILWKDIKKGGLSDKDAESAAFTIFLFGRLVGSAAEIDDHINRGRDMDTRTPASRCGFVS